MSAQTEVLSLSSDELLDLDQKIENALATLDPGDLQVLGYGEISTALAVQGSAGRFAVKRLPVFDSRERFEKYAALFSRYLLEMKARQIQNVDSHLKTLALADGRIKAYCIQPVLDSGSLLPVILSSAGEDEGKKHIENIVDLCFGAIQSDFGLDSQLSNWSFLNGTYYYIDVTTPLLRDADGRILLDRDIFIASLPALFRPLVRAFVVDGIIEQYHDARRALLDLAANLIKEGLERWLEDALALINKRVSPAISKKEVERYYRSDARMWALLQFARRLDRVWQRWIRRRVYPFLLPGKIAR
jgi:hypothetical protein